MNLPGKPLFTAELDCRGLPVLNRLGAARTSPKRSERLGICMSVVRGRLSDGQAKRLFEFLTVNEIEERNPRRRPRGIRGVTRVQVFKDGRSGASVPGDEANLDSGD